MLGGKALCRVQITVLPPSSSRACRITSSMPSIRDAPVQTSSRGRIIRRKHAAEVNVQMNQNLARLKSFSGRPLSRHAPSLRRLERDVVSAELGIVEIIAPAERASPQQRRRRTAASWQSFMPARRNEVELLLLDVIPVTTRMSWMLQFNSPRVFNKHTFSFDSVTTVGFEGQRRRRGYNV